MNAPLDVTRRDATLELTLNRPECRNALSQELITRLTDAFHAAEADVDVRGVILTGAPPAFCAGLDLREVAAGAATAHDTTPLLALFETIDRLPKPVLAAVNGPAVAGGAGLVSVCDIVVCGETARIGYPGIHHGLVAPVLMPYLLRLVGERRARHLLLMGDLLTAPQAVAYGLADEVVSDHELLWRVRELAAALAQHPPQAVAETKAALRALRDWGGADHAARLRELAGSVRLTDEAQRGMRRFLEM